MPAVAESEVVVEVMPVEAHRGAGRPPLYDESLPAIIAALEEGNTQANAARLSGIHPDTLSRWKREKEDFAEVIARAEAVYIADVRRRLRNCTTKWGTSDPKAIDIETRRIPEFRQVQEIETRNTNLSLSLTLDATQIAQLQQMWSGQAIEDTK